MELCQVGAKRSWPARSWAGEDRLCVTRYISKKKNRVVGPDGELSQDLENLKDPLQWGEDARLRLAFQAVAEEAGVPPSQVLEGVDRLFSLLPGLEGRLQALKPGDLARLGLRADRVAERLVLLKQLLPTADIQRLVGRAVWVLSCPDQELVEGVGRARELLGTLGSEEVDVLAEVQPMVLKPGVLEGAVGEIRRLLNTDPGRLLLGSPDFLFVVQSLEGQQRGDRDAEYLAEIYRSTNHGSMATPPEP